MNRDQLIDKLSKAGVGTSVHFIPIFRQPYYRKTYSLRTGDFPNTDRLYKSVITLPLYPGITKSEVGEVVRRMKQIIAGRGR
jgi:dTDP-4-amino-4,6-dideoxygalactose transaminase